MRCPALRCCPRCPCMCCSPRCPQCSSRTDCRARDAHGGRNVATCRERGHGLDPSSNKAT
eukprot:2546864-Alexandrium_andersonii.AAC.1